MKLIYGVHLSGFYLYMILYVKRIGKNQAYGILDVHILKPWCSILSGFPGRGGRCLVSFHRCRKSK